MNDQPLPRDRFIPWYFVAAFLLLFVIDGVMVTAAIRTQTGVVADHAYERGLAYNTYIAEQAAQAARGWQSHLAYREGLLIADLSKRDGSPLTGAAVTVSLMRPVQAGMDFNVPLTEVAPGRYQAAASFPQPGLWTATVVAGRDGQPYRISQDIVVRP